MRALYRRLTVTHTLVALLGALLVALLVAGRLVRPQRSLTQAARRLAAGEQHEPVPTPKDTELAELPRPSTPWPPSSPARRICAARWSPTSPTSCAPRSA